MSPMRPEDPEDEVLASPPATSRAADSGASAVPMSCEEALPPDALSDDPPSDMPRSLDEQAARRTVMVRAVRTPAARVRVVMPVRRAADRTRFRSYPGRD